MCANEGCGMVVNKSEKENHEKYLCKFRIAKGEETTRERIQVKQSFVFVPVYIHATLTSFMLCIVNIISSNLYFRQLGCNLCFARTTLEILA